MSDIDLILDPKGRQAAREEATLMFGSAQSSTAAADAIVAAYLRSAGSPADNVGRAMASLSDQQKDNLLGDGYPSPAATPHAREGGTDDLYALLYLHDWDEPRDGEQPVYPQCHALYAAQKEAEAVRRTMTLPEKYWVVRARWESPARILSALSSPAPGQEA